ncbi:LysR family transcriptional regulator [Roseovarius sp. MMSF_3281]|uniref:LysR family transcriptional regulator n=1 Tax=Roseovarius sp. MMSF_3281 TaxID=3046694 RepID=UPI00273EC17D|nr:LysR family transcriptional regulator [Roseovarius sp. MMSF_3281]
MAKLYRELSSSKALFIFEAAARCGSFTAAASEFNVSQPSISRTIGQLEEILGFPLFLRRARGIKLTPEGRMLYDSVSIGFGGIETALQIIRQRRERLREKPLVTLSLSSSFVAHWLVPRFSEFNERFPDVDLRFELVSGKLGDIPNSVDLATRVVEPDEDRYVTWAFAPEVILPVCSPQYLEQHGPICDAGGHVLLHLSDHDEDDWRGIHLSAGTEDRNTWHVFSDYSVVLQAALAGKGIALGWLSVLSGALLDERLVPASTHCFTTGRVHSLVAPAARPIPAVVTEIRDWLIAEMDAEVKHVRDKFSLQIGLA